MAETKTVILPSGKTATVRTPATGRDLINAYKVLPRKANPGQISMALVAQLAAIDGRQLLYEDTLDLPLEDINALMDAAGMTDDANPTFPPPPSSPPSSGSDSQ